MSHQDSRSAREVTVRVVSPRERMRLGVGACRRLDDALIDRQVFLACAAEFRDGSADPIRLDRIARVVGLAAEVVWEVIARHVLVDGVHDSWIEFAFEPPSSRPGAGDPEVPDSPPSSPPDGLLGVWGCDDLSLRLAYSGRHREFIDLALRRWPDDLFALAADLVVGVWNGDHDGFECGARFLGVMFDCLQPEWWLDLWFDGLTRTRGNLMGRAEDMPSRNHRPHVDHDLVRQRMLPETPRTDLVGRFARRLLALDLGSLPERVLACPGDEWGAAGQLLCVLFKRELLGVAERLEARLFDGDGLFDFLAAIVEADADDFECAVGLLYDMTTGSEAGARRFVDALRARKGYDLPRPLREGLVERLSLGLAAVVEAVDTADPTMGVEIMAIYRRWREELERFRWSQSVGWKDHAACWEDRSPQARPSFFGQPAE